MVDLLQFIVDHHSIGIIGYSQLLGEGVLLSLVGDKERNRFFDMIQGKLLYFACNISLFTTVQEDYDASIFSAFTESFISLLCQRSNICFLSLFVEFLCHPFQNGKFLMNSFIQTELIYFFRSILVEAYSGVFSQSQLFFKLMVVSFSKVYFGDFSSTLKFCTELFPFTIEVQTSRVVTLIEVDDERFS